MSTFILYIFLLIVKLDRNIICQSATKIDFEWQKFFSPDELDRLARQCGFSKRNSKQNKISGATFFDLIVMNNDMLNSQSLNDLCSELYLRKGITIAEQSLNERFNSAATVFLKCILEKVIHNQFSAEFKNVKTAFKRLLVKDSTCFQISPELAEIYTGSGGAGSKASIRIQFEYDLLSGNIVDISINAFNDQDAKNSALTLDRIQENDLIIRDLAYMYRDIYTGIAKRIARYLCRLGHNVSVYVKEASGYEKLNFKKLLAVMKKTGITKIEKNVFVTEDKIPTRLFIYLLPEDIVEKRLRNKASEALRKGRKMPSEEYRIRQHFNLLLTNAQKDEITIDTAYEVYRLRWQIELIFKTWKSVCSLDKVKNVKQHRVECYVFSKLIILMMGWKIFWNLNTACYNKCNSILSQYKFFKVFKTQIRSLSEILISKLSVENIMQKINSIIDRLRLNVKKDENAPVDIINNLLCLG